MVSVGDFIQRNDTKEVGVVVAIKLSISRVIVVFRMKPGYSSMRVNPDFYLAEWSMVSIAQKQLTVLPYSEMPI